MRLETRDRARGRAEPVAGARRFEIPRRARRGRRRRIDTRGCWSARASIQTGPRILSSALTRLRCRTSPEHHGRCHRRPRFPDLRAPHGDASSSRRRGRPRAARVVAVRASAEERQVRAITRDSLGPPARRPVPTATVVRPRPLVLTPIPPSLPPRSPGSGRGHDVPPRGRAQGVRRGRRGVRGPPRPRARALRPGRRPHREVHRADHRGDRAGAYTLDLPADSSEKEQAIEKTRTLTNAWVAKYRRDKAITGRPSYGNAYSPSTPSPGTTTTSGPSTPSR